MLGPKTEEDLKPNKGKVRADIFSVLVGNRHSLLCAAYNDILKPYDQTKLKCSLNYYIVVFKY